MKLNASIAAITLSIVAIVISLAQPTYDLLTSLGEKGKPSFNVYSFDVIESKTDMSVQNNGTSTATDVRVLLIFDDDTNRLEGWTYTEFITEIEEGHAAMLKIPIGLYLLESLAEKQGFTNITHYKAWIHVWCSETRETPATFVFEDFIAQT